MSGEPAELTLVELLPLLDRRELSARELVESCLARIGGSAPWSVTGFPAPSVPVGLDARGLPVGLVLAALPEREGDLVGVGISIDEDVAFWRQGPGGA